MTRLDVIFCRATMHKLFECDALILTESSSSHSPHLNILHRILQSLLSKSKRLNNSFELLEISCTRGNTILERLGTARIFKIKLSHAFLCFIRLEKSAEKFYL